MIEFHWLYIPFVIGCVIWLLIIILGVIGTALNNDSIDWIEIFILCLLLLLWIGTFGGLLWW